MVDSLLINFTFIAVVGGILLVPPALAWFFLRRGLRARAAEAKRDSKQDLVNMMILFQTMRDIVEQQKDLARALNKSLDAKVAYIKETVDTALGDVQTLRDSVKDLSRILDDTRSELNRVHEHAGEAARGLGSNGFQRTATVDSEQTDELERPVLHILAKPTPPMPKDNMIDSWVGLDFGGDWPDPHAVDVPEEIPEVAPDADSARDAFRALLNLCATPAPQPARQSAPRPRSTQESAKAPDDSRGNGKMNALHARVCEYSDAGMGIAQIARELGLGKGEVRLILGLRKDRGQ